jgi:uncharacterized membrane protein YuzA (DUF378 family)
MAYCQNCGVKLVESNKFCPNCGVPIKQQYQGPYSTPYPYPYPQYYQTPKLSIVASIMVIISGVFLLLTGILFLLMFILGVTTYFVGIPTIIYALIGFTGFVFSIMAMITINKKRNYPMAHFDTEIVVILCFILIILGAPNLFALIFAILGMVFLFVSKKEFHNNDHVNVKRYSDPKISYSPPKPALNNRSNPDRRRNIERRYSN